MKKRIITISREFGSGSHSIGKIVAETLGTSFYDQELLEKKQKKPVFQKNLLKIQPSILLQKIVFSSTLLSTVV